MALVKCTECGHEMSSRASKCPQCGCPISDILKEYENKEQELLLEKKNVQKKKRKKIISTVIVLFFIICMIMVYLSRKITPIDYKYVIGTNYKEYTGLNFKEETWWSTMSPDLPKLYEASEEYEYMDMNGELVYRYMDGDYYEHVKDEIFYVSWSPVVESDDVEIIDEKQLDKLIKMYDRTYGNHIEQKGDIIETETEYIWNAGDNISFTINVSEGRTNYNLTWLHVEDSTI